MKWDKNDWQGKTKEEIEYFDKQANSPLVFAILYNKSNELNDLITQRQNFHNMGFIVSNFESFLLKRYS